MEDERVEEEMRGGMKDVNEEEEGSEGTVARLEKPKNSAKEKEYVRRRKKEKERRKKKEG